MVIKTFLTGAAAIFAVAGISVTAAPLANAANEVQQFPPNSGGFGSHYWHSEDQFQINWKDHSINVPVNITSNMPGWQSGWGPGGNWPADTKLAARAGGSSIFGHVVNKCPNTVYVHTSLGANPDQGIAPMDDPSDPTATYPIASGATYTTSIQAVLNGHGGVAIKLSPTDSISAGNVYQLEYSVVQNDQNVPTVWYDLSNVDGAPFIGVPRYAQIGEPNTGCTSIYNAPGSNAADWPAITANCANAQDFWFYLC